MFTSLHNRNYRIYASGAAVSNVGTWMQRVAQAWLVLKLAHGDATALGVVTGLQFLPTLLATPVGGTVADRFNRRRTLLVTQLSSGLLGGVLAVAAITGHLSIAGVDIVALLVGVVAAVEAPVRQVFLHDIVGGEDLPNAIALNSASFNGARLVGPALGGLVIAGVGVGWAIAADAASYLAVAASLLAIGRNRAGVAALVRRHVKAGSWRQALGSLRGRGDIWLIFVIVGMVGTFGLNFTMTTALMSTQVFGKGAAAYGVLSSVMAIGSLAGALAAARRPVIRLRLIVVSAVAFGGFETLAGLAPDYWLFMATLPLIGLSTLTLITAANSYVQLAADTVNRGRVMAAYTIVFLGGTPVGAPLVGMIGSHAGARWTLLAGGLVSLAATVVAALVFMRRMPHPALLVIRRTGLGS